MLTTRSLARSVATLARILASIAPRPMQVLCTAVISVYKVALLCFFNLHCAEKSVAAQRLVEGLLSQATDLVLLSVLQHLIVMLIFLRPD